jgi:hypothetical protein
MADNDGRCSLARWKILTWEIFASAGREVGEEMARTVIEVYELDGSGAVNQWDGKKRDVTIRFQA